MQKGGVLEVGAFYDGVDGACLLAEAAENALSHIDVVLGRAARAVRSWLRLDSDGEGRARSLAQLARDATLLTGWVASEGVLTTEHRRERTLLPWVVQNVIRLHRGPNTKEHRWPRQLSHDNLAEN